MHQVIAEIESSIGVTGRVLRKRGEPALWMEIYEDVIDTNLFDATLTQCLLRLNFERFLQPGTTRKTEHFDPCA